MVLVLHMLFFLNFILLIWSFNVHCLISRTLLQLKVTKRDSVTRFLLFYPTNLTIWAPFSYAEVFSNMVSIFAEIFATKTLLFWFCDFQRFLKDLRVTSVFKVLKICIPRWFLTKCSIFSDWDGRLILSHYLFKGIIILKVYVAEDC